jgi:hypothetical protein
MDRAFRASKRGAAAEETTPKKRKRSPSLPRTPGQGDEPAPPAEDLSPPRKKQLFANAVQLSRCVKVRRCCGRAAAPRGGNWPCDARRAWRDALTPPRAAAPPPAGSWCTPTTTCARG